MELNKMMSLKNNTAFDAYIDALKAKRQAVVNSVIIAPLEKLEQLRGIYLGLDDAINLADRIDSHQSKGLEEEDGGGGMVMRTDL